MNLGVGISREKDTEVALTEAYRKSLQNLSATKADFSFVFYSYDHALDSGKFSALLRKVLKYVPHMGASTWGAWVPKEGFEAETGLMVVSLKDVSLIPDIFKVHSLKEKESVWAAELGRSISDKYSEDERQESSLLLLADSLTFNPGEGFLRWQSRYPEMQTFGFGTSYGIPQCSVVHDAEVYMNSMIGLFMKRGLPWVALLQSVEAESDPISINRMSENLVIEIDGKQAFYRLSEHLMIHDDLPMMSPDEFRKHMGNLYLVEKSEQTSGLPRVIGEPSHIISLLGSEMITGMVAVASPLDLAESRGRRHYIGQKKPLYSDDRSWDRLQELKAKVPHPSMIWSFIAGTRARDRDRKRKDVEMIEATFPKVPQFAIATNGEYLGGVNQFAAMVVAFP